MTRTAFAHAEHCTKPLQEMQTLVLNADGQILSTWPLSTEGVFDAIHSYVRGRVTIVEAWPDRFVNSPSVKIPVPKVVMLCEYAPVHGKPKFCRRSVFLRDRFRCQYCGEQFPSHELTFDHVIPRDQGGKTVWENILTACLKCNSKKGNKLPNYSGRKGDATRPFKRPRCPTRAELLRAGLEFLPAQVRETWGEHLYWGVELEP